MHTLSTENLSFSYSEVRSVLHDINLNFEQGKVYAIVGPSGCGKTTLRSLLGGLDVPTGGKVLFDGQDIGTKDLSRHRREHVAFVFQNYNLVEYMTPLENVELTAVTPPMEMLARVGLSNSEAKRNVLKLSGGQQQRVAIARALASGVPFILADEPTGNLDEDTADDITNLLCEVAKEDNRCVVVVTHNREIALRADEVYALNKGELVLSPQINAS